MAIEQTLQQLDAWYNELPGGTDRPKLLSKLAALELCGWIELRMDEIVRTYAAKLALDPAWVEKSVIGHTNGFQYEQHFRTMLRLLMGEARVIAVEQSVGIEEGGDLARMKALLGVLWKIRNRLAHTNTQSANTTQESIQAPSWSNNQQRIVAKLLEKFESELLKI